jgi:phosphatidylglycerophosphate synthase
LRILIDATERVPGLSVFGMGLFERLVRGVLEAGLEPEEIRVVLGEIVSEPRLPRDLRERLSVHFERRLGWTQALAASLDAGAPVLVLQANSIVDTRLIAQLVAAQGSVAFVAGHSAERGGAAKLEPGVHSFGPDSLGSIDGLVAAGEARLLREDEFSGYITMLRRELAPYLFRIRDGAGCQRAERFLFWSNYKGSTDFMTRYVYPPLVWAMVRPLARWRVHPNWVTAVDIVATFAAVPFFWAGAWLPGLLLAYLMSVLDSVDGKLARVTFTSSKLGEILDHGLDIVHPPIWYLAWGAALGGGGTASDQFRAGIAMLALYVVDRAVAGVFKHRLGRSIHGYTPFDERMRTFISRRNVNLVVFTLALAVDALAGTPGWPAATVCFYALVIWQALCLAFHLQRLGRFWGDARPAAVQNA